jgi:tetratricopeptide (TPR) repeat protein
MARLTGSDDCGPVAAFRAGLQQLFLQVRRPTYRTLVGHADRAGLVLRVSTIGTLLNGPGTPRWGTVEAFVNACAQYAQSHRIDVPADSFDLDEWHARYQGMEDAADAQRDGTDPDTKPARRGRDDWAVVPAQLPADVHGFTGRRDQLHQLDELIAPPPLPGASEGRGRSPKTVMIIAVSGTAGVGKTALAVHWAHTVTHRFPDGQLYVNLRGFDPGGRVMDPADAIRGFLDALGVPPERIPVGLDAQEGLYRSLLAQKGLLIVLDNARDTEQIRPLLPASGTCLAVVTSRNTLTGLSVAYGAHSLLLDMVPPDEAREILARRLDTDRVRADPAATDEIVLACARLPLALAIAAARTRQTRFPLAVLAADLRDAAQRLDVLDAGDPSSQIRAVFLCSYTALTAPAARLFRLLGLHPGPDIDTVAAANLAGHTTAQIRRLLAELVQASMLTEYQPGRYIFHDLLRTYAGEQTHTQDTEQQRHAAIDRLLNYYLNTAYAGALLLSPSRQPIEMVNAVEKVISQPLTDVTQALDWFTIERPVLLAAIEHAAGSGFDAHAWQLFWSLDTFLYRRGHWHDRVAAGRAGVAAAGRLADPAGRQRTHRLLGEAYTELHRFEDAHVQLSHALAVAAESSDHAALGETHSSLAVLCGRQGDHRRAYDHACAAVDEFQAAGDQAGEAWALNQVGWQNTCSAKHEQALVSAHRALRLHRNLGDRAKEAACWDTIGYAHHHLGHHSEAITHYLNALTVYRDLGDRYGTAEVLKHLGDTHHSTGDMSAARDAWQQALAILNDLDHPDAAAVRTKLESDPSGRPA